MDTQHVPPSVWQQMIQQSFLSLYERSEDKYHYPEQLFQGYDFIFEFFGATVYLIINDVVMPTNQQQIDSTQVREWRKEVVNQLIRRHAPLYLKNDKAAVDKPTYFIGLTSLAIDHKGDTLESQPYAVNYEYGSQFFAEDCVLDLDDEQSVLQIFSHQNFIEILNQLVTPSDLTAFLDFHRRKLAGFETFQDESTLLAQFLQSPDFHQRAIEVQEQLVAHQLIDQVEPRLLKAAEPNQTAFANALMLEIQKNTRMWYKLFNSLIQHHYEVGMPLPKEQVDVLVDESMYTYACLIEKILAHRSIDQDSSWSGYVRHEHSYHVFGRHYLMVFYAQDKNSSLSADKVRASHQDLLFELNSQMQQPVMDDLFLIGIEVRPCEDSVNTEVHIDTFHQNGSAIDANTQRLYEQLAELRSQS